MTEKKIRWSEFRECGQSSGDEARENKKGFAYTDQFVTNDLFSMVQFFFLKKAIFLYILKKKKKNPG